MPYCPKCREEFREGGKVCPDCGVELVAELPRLEAAGPAEQAVFVATSAPHVAERVDRACRTAGIPCMQVGDEEGARGVLFPREIAGRAVGWITSQMRDLILEAPREEGGPFLIREFDPLEDGGVEGSEVIFKDPAELSRDPEALERLLQVAAAGDVSAHVQAVERLLDFGEEGRRALGRLISELCREGNEERLSWAFSACHSSEIPGLSEKIEPLLSSEDPDVVILSLRVCWRFRLENLAPKVCDLLLHENPLVQEEADEVLLEITGKDLGFQAGAPLEERERIKKTRLAQLGLERK